MKRLSRSSHATACLAFALLAGACRQPAMEHAETKAAVAVSVETAVVDRIDATLTVSGTVEPAPGGDWIITAPESARIAELPKAEGDAVREGDLLVRFDIPTLPAQLAARQSEVVSAKARVTRETAEIARLGPLVEKGVAAARDLDDARRGLAEAQADVAQAESAVAAATALAARATVRATFAGVVARRWHNAGDFVEAASNPVLRVIDPARLQVTAAVPPSDIPRITAGLGGFVIGPSGEGEPLKVVTKPAQVDATTTLAPVRLAFTKATRLPPGAAVQVVIVTDSHEKAVVIPASAIVHDEDDVFVMVIDKDLKAHRHDVTVGLSSGGRIEILNGVVAGDVVAYRGQDELPDGGLVTIVK